MSNPIEQPGPDKGVSPAAVMDPHPRGPLRDSVARMADFGHCGKAKNDVVALAALLAAITIFFWKIALSNRVLAGLDVFAYFYPYRDYVSAALLAGRLPLWNPHLFMGAPLLANSQAAVLYPLHWPLIWLSAPKQVAWSVLLHLWLAGAGAYLYARLVMRLGSLAAFVTGVIFALGGFLGAQVEHLNQLNASAWLPWLLLTLEGMMLPGRRRWLAVLAGGAVVGLTLLAGHTQAAYIVLFAAAVYAGLRGGQDPLRPWWQGALTGLAALALMAIVGMALAAGQLLPSLELSRLSVRSGGLPYNEAASFSLPLWLVFKAFLPPLAWDPPFSEYVAFIGLLGLTLAGIGAWAILKPGRSGPGQRQDEPSRSILPYGRTMLVLALLGVFLALGAYNPVYHLLYRLVPGFNLFRAPARWLLLYSLGSAMLAGIGLEALPKLKSGRAKAAIVLLLVLELFLASRRLAYNQPTAPAAFDSLRTAPAHLLADESVEPFRFLSMSDIGYDPGDLGDLQAMYGPQLPEDAVYDLIVATKMKEVLAFNLPLRYRLSSIDGYDGGLLPIAPYVVLERLFLAEDEIWPDGRLRQQLRQVPPARLLSLLNVKYVITDKTQDVWVDDVFYDLEHTVPLGKVILADLPDFESTHLGVASYLTGTTDLVDGTPVAQVTITDTRGSAVAATLRAGFDTAEALYDLQPVRHRQARVGHRWRDNELGNDYIAVLDLEKSLQPVSISVSSLLPDGRFYLRGLTLIDGNTQTNRSLSVDPAYTLVHSGDVKIYENLAKLPPAFVVHQARVVSDDQAALDILRSPDLDPAREVILSDGEPLASEDGESNVDLIAYRAEQIQLAVTLDAPGYLVLTDAYYPGWTAEVDGRAATILRADLYFRAIALEPGDHEVTFRFRPASVRIGLGVSLVAWLVFILLLAIVPRRTGRKMPTDV
jgi:hypothetical protein